MDILWPKNKEKKILFVFKMMTFLADIFAVATLQDATKFLKCFLRNLILYLCLSIFCSSILLLLKIKVKV